MNRTKGDAEDGKPAATVSGEAANEAVIDGAGRPVAWDPFEVWRTRVRDVRDERLRRQKPSAED